MIIIACCKRRNGGGQRCSEHTVKGQLIQTREVGEKVGKCLEQGKMGGMVVNTHQAR